MSDLIRVLENIGQNPQLRYASGDELMRLIRSEGVDPSVMEASRTTCCLIHAPEGEEEHKGEHGEPSVREAA